MVASHQLSALALIMGCLLAPAVAQNPGPKRPPNVLFLAIDDLRPDLGCYGVTQAKTPHMDRLAASSLRFDRAYCQQAICGPSRASLLTGLRPDSAGVHGNHRHFREHHPNLPTLPQWFKQQGYHSQSLGKIYHGVFPPGSSRTVADTFGDAPSWSVPTFRPGPRYYYTEAGIAAARQVYRRIYKPQRPGPDDWTSKLVFGPATEAPTVADGVLYDGQVADRAVQTLRRLAKRRQPFFLAVGFIKPHSPYIAPRRYWDLYDPEQIELAPDSAVVGAPRYALHGSGELRRYTDQRKRGPIPAADRRMVRHAYLACTSYVDAQLGKVLAELDRLQLADDTIVVLWSDHGYHLGEAGLWGKTTNRELDTRVVLMIRKPGAVGHGRATKALVELVDLYPTLVELAGLPKPGHLEGSSLVPLLEQPDRAWKRAAYSQYSRQGKRGYSLRTARYRYTEWYRLTDWRLLARELYDLEVDPAELHNIAAAADSAAVVEQLQAWLQRGEGWRATAAALARPPALFRLAPVFSDHMVLQRGVAIRVFGEGRPGAQIEASFAGQTATARVSSGGRWTLQLPPQPTSRQGRRLELRARAAGQKQDETLRNVVVGDVWLCAGQSNMRWRARQAAEAQQLLPRQPVSDLRLIDFEGALYPSHKAYSRAFLRGVNADNYYSTQGWRPATAASVASFSAVAYAFGRRLQAELGVPIGLLHNAVGGVPMEAYLPPAAQIRAAPLRAMMRDWLRDPRYPAWCRLRVNQNLARWLADPQGPRPVHPFAPSFLYRAGIAPIRQLGIKGVIWYQGESNATGTAAGPARDPRLNKMALQALIHGFRETWQQPELPFYFVQLPGLNRQWALFREVQAEVARETAHCEMAVAIDLGHPNDVHPRRKLPVGERLADLALAGSYGRPGMVHGPRYRGHRRVGTALRVSFDHALGLRSSDGEALRGFQLAGKNRVFHPAEARVLGQEVLVHGDQVPRPVALRYAFAPDPRTNLVNAASLPAAPFRTDDWPVPVDGPQPAQAGPGSFEQAPAGPLRDLRTPLGRFEAAAGHAEINSRFARSGRQCLRLHGGKDRSLVFTPKDTSADRLSFWAERWTRKSPFTFRIDARIAGRWREIYVGDQVLRVGARFLSHVRVTLPEGTRRLRFRSTAPQGAGVLLDDFELRQAGPMQLLGAAMEDSVVPALRGKAVNPVTRFVVETKGAQAPRSLRRVRVSIPEGTRLEDIAAVRVYLVGLGPRAATPFAAAQQPARQLVFEGNAELHSGRNVFFVSFQVAAVASLDRRVSARIDGLEFDRQGKLPVAGMVRPQRIGVALRTSGSDGCHTYRIPGLVTTNKGSLIAVYDCRYRGSKDLPGDIDVGMSRSTDGGANWEKMRVIMDMGRDPKWRYDGVGDPAILVDRRTGTIWVAATWSHGNRSWHGSGPGLRPEETGQLMLARSDDDGRTWSRPINITRQVKRPEWRFVLQGPGKGITMQDGTLVFAAQYRSSDDSPYRGRPFSTLIYSKDRGQTWHCGTGVKVDTTEAQLVELDQGVLMINCRDNRGGARSIYTTVDLGRSWKLHPSSRKALPEPVCMASLIRVRGDAAAPLLVFSNPATRRGRFDMTLKLSLDGGRSWPPRFHLKYDERRGAGYSCLTQIGAGHVGVLYEGHRELYFLRVPLRELRQGR